MDLVELYDELHHWLEGSESCRYSPENFCPHFGRSRNLAQKLIDMGWINGSE